MSGVKLIDKSTGKLTDIDPAQVNDAIDSDKFAFDKTRNYPVINNGEPKFVSWDDAAKYRKRLEFTTSDDVKNYRAEDRMKGVLPKLGAAAYGAASSMTLGAVPYLTTTLGGEAGRQYEEDVDRGAPKSRLAGEVLGMFMDPVAIGGRVLGRGAAKGAEVAGRVAQEAGQLAPTLGRRVLGADALTGIEAAGARQVESIAEREAAQRGVAATQSAVSLGGQTAMASKTSPVIRGGQALAPTAEEAATLTAQREFRSKSKSSFMAREAAAAKKAEADEAVRLSRIDPTAQAGLRLEFDPYQTPELAARARQAEDLRVGIASAREGQAAMAADAANMERGLRPGARGPVEDFAQMPDSAMESEYLQSELARVDEALAANAAATRRARSSASRNRIGMERERLLEERKRAAKRAMRGGMRADEDLAAQAGRAFDATHMQEAAPYVAREAANLGAEAEALEAYNTAAPTLGQAATKVGKSDTVALGERYSRPLGRSAIGQDAAAAMRGAEGLAPETVATSIERMGGTLPEAGPSLGGMPAVAAPAAEAAQGMGRGGQMLQAGIMTTLEKRARQEAGVEEGGLKEALQAGVLGAAAVPAFALGAKALGLAGGGVAKLGGAAVPGGISAKLERAAAKLDESATLRTFGINAGQAGKIQRVLKNPELETLGTREVSDFVRRELAAVDALKALPENAKNVNLQSINPGSKLSGLSEEQRIAFTSALNDALNKQRVGIFEQVGNPAIDPSALESLLVHGVAKKGAGGTGLTQIKPFVDEIAQALANKEPFTLNDIHTMKSALSDALNSAHDKSPWTAGEADFYNSLKNLIQGQVGAANPALLEQLAAIDKSSFIAIELQKGAEKLAAGHSVTQVLGADLLAQIGLGAFAMGRPLSAISFGMGAVALRSINLHRGDGIIADLAGGLGSRIATNPQAAAQQVTQGIFRSSAPRMIGIAAQQFTQTSPQGYSQMSALVKQLADQRETVKADMLAKMSSLSPQDQQKHADYFDAQVAALQAAQPKGLATSDALTRAQQDFVVFGRSVLNPTVAMQLILNGGPAAQQAAKGLNATPQGAQTLAAIQSQFAAVMNENTEARGNKEMQEVYKSIAKSSKSGKGSLTLIHPQAQPQAATAAPKPDANVAKAAAAFSGGT
jgi:hypothetical protein